MLKAITCILIAFSVNLSIYASGAAVELPNKTPDQAKQFVEKTLNKIEASYSEDEETEGFRYRLNTSWYSPYTFDIFIGTYGDDHKTFVRIDAPNRMGWAFGDVLMQENGSKPFQKKYQPKSVLLGDFLTLLSPSFGYYYTNTDSPFAPKTVWTRSLIYFGLDLLFLWVGGKTFFTHGFDPLDRGKISTAILMGGFRLFTLIPHHMQLTANNRMVNLGYTFRF